MIDDREIEYLAHKILIQAYAGDPTRYSEARKCATVVVEALREYRYETPRKGQA